MTSSDDNPFCGDLTCITDGEIAGDDGYYVELAPQQQWVQIDLGEMRNMEALWIWRYFKQPVVYRSVVIAISASADLTSPVIVWNSDSANAAGFGVGVDPTYVETNFGKAIRIPSVKGRYVRLYSCGRNVDEMNHYTEVQVYGR